MGAVPVQAFATRGGSLRTRVVATVVCAILSSLVLAAGLILTDARADRRAIEERVITTAAALAHAVEREVVAAGHLLQGLSTSPMLQTGDYRGFYDQLASVRAPERSWFVLWNVDEQRQVINTRKHYGEPLPTFVEVGPEIWPRMELIRKQGLSISNLLLGTVSREFLVSVNLRIDDADGRMKHVLTMVVSRDHLKALFDEQRLPPTWIGIIVDRERTPIVATNPVLLERLDAEVAAKISGSMTEGSFEGAAQAGRTALLAFNRSASAGWTAIAAVPLAIVNAPLDRAYRQIGLGGLGLLFVGVLAAGIIGRRLGAPSRRSRNRRERWKSATGRTGITRPNVYS